MLYASARSQHTPVLWEPSRVPTNLWLDAKDESTITESGGAVSQWDDKSGNDNHAVQELDHNNRHTQPIQS